MGNSPNRVGTCACITCTLRCAPETRATLQSNCTPTRTSEKILNGSDKKRIAVPLGSVDVS